MGTHRGPGKDLAATAAGLMLLAPGPAHAARQPRHEAAAARAVDQLLAGWNRPDTPGCAVEVIRAGQVLYRRGVGMADLERDARISPATPFHAGSMSRQFTAFAIHLLAQDGKLALGDDIRQYLPELRDFGRTITIGHLLHHTSGLRDQWSLLALAGWRREDVITEDDIFRLLKRQQALDFEPGQEHRYSSTGSTLLGMVVKRVSGQPLPAFAQQRIFGPLGMRHTHFHDNYGTLVKGRALSYGPSASGDFDEYVALPCSSVGATSLFTTVDDLALWSQNFHDGRVGGMDLLDRMQATGVSSSGTPITSASGLVIGQYRGLTTASDAGADAGYRSELLRFPGQRFAVAILANAGDAINTASLSLRIADIYLAGLLQSAPEAPALKPAPAEVQIDPARTTASPIGEAQLAGYAGQFYSEELHVLYTVSHRNGKLVIAHPRGEIDLDNIGSHLFAAGYPLGRVEFQCQPDSGCSGFTINDGRVRKLKFARVRIEPALARPA